MTMPEATIHKNNRSVPGKNYVWFTRQIRGMESESVSHGMQQAPHTQLGSGVTGPNPPHQFASLARIENVSHFRGAS
jgi:hypothetical protein